MIKLKHLKITIDYSPEHDKHNHDLVGYVIQRYPRRVVKTSVVARDSVDKWYESIAEQYPRKTFITLIGTISLVGEVLGTALAEEEERDSGASQGYSRPKDPGAN